MNKEEIIKIELNGKIICSKLLFLNDNLISIREKIKNEINFSFLFLDEDGNKINKENEIDFLLNDIKIGNVIKLTTKSIIKIELDGEIICSKPLVLNDNLISIREKIKNRINSSFLFLDKDANTIYKEDENDYLLEDITIGNVIKLTTKSIKSIIKIELDGKIIGSKPLFLSDNLISIREKLKNEINTSFLFLDEDGNEIYMEDENDFLLKDIINGKLIKLTEKSLINIFLNDTKITYLMIQKNKNLNELRNLLLIYIS
jgi:hypothetical protein